jgi:hypothetical protein
MALLALLCFETDNARIKNRTQASRARSGATVNEQRPFCDFNAARGDSASKRALRPRQPASSHAPKKYGPSLKGNGDQGAR